MIRPIFVIVETHLVRAVMVLVSLMLVAAVNTLGAATSASRHLRQIAQSLQKCWRELFLLEAPAPIPFCASRQIHPCL